MTGGNLIRTLASALVLVALACTRGRSREDEPDRVPLVGSSQLVPPSAVHQEAVLELHIDGTGEIQLGKVGGSMAASIPVASREAGLRQAFASWGNVRIDIFAPRDVPHGIVIATMDALRTAGFTHLQFGIRR